MIGFMGSSFRYYALDQVQLSLWGRSFGVASAESCVIAEVCDRLHGDSKWKSGAGLGPELQVGWWG